jgi:REP element-mobilizing transposase RayT
MPTHWHLVIQPANGKELSQFMQWFTGTHAQRWQAFRQSAGLAAVYQGRYKAIQFKWISIF